MLLYLSIFLVPCIYYIVGRNNPNIASSSKICGIVFLLIALFVGMGDMQGGYDRYAYGAYFDSVADSIRGNWIWQTYGSEYGYSLFNWLVAHFTANRYIYILVATLTMYYLYFRAFKTYLEEYPLAMIVFMGLLYYFTMTYMRQTLAVGFAWQACRYAYQRRPVPFFLWMAVAYSFHNSAIIFAIMYFVPVKKFSNRTVFWLMIVMFLIGFTPLVSWAMNTFGDVTETEGRTAAYVEGATGYNVGYLCVAVFFAWLMVKNSDLIKNTRKDIFFYNMGLMYCAVLLSLIRSGNTGRLGWYYMFGLIYTLSLIAQRNKSSAQMRTFIIVLSFLMFFRITYTWNFNLSPYKTFLSNGYPCGIRGIYDENEYDTQYTINKLYRPAFDFCDNLDLKFEKAEVERQSINET